SFERYIAAHVARDQETGGERMVRKFIAELRGITGSAGRKAVLADTGMSHAALASLFEPDGSPHRVDIARLLAACQKHTSPVKPKALEIIGRDHLLMSFRAAGVHEIIEEHARRFIEPRLAREALAEWTCFGKVESSP